MCVFQTEERSTSSIRFQAREDAVVVVKTGGKVEAKSAIVEAMQPQISPETLTKRTYSCERLTGCSYQVALPTSIRVRSHSCVWTQVELNVGEDDVP